MIGRSGDRSGRCRQAEGRCSDVLVLAVLACLLWPVPVAAQAIYPACQLTAVNPPVSTFSFQVTLRTGGPRSEDSSPSNIPAGTRKVTVQSWDQSHPTQDEPNESWYVDIRLADGSTQTLGPTSDLPAAKQAQVQVLNPAFTYTSNIVLVTARHAASSGNNSVAPLCVVFGDAGISEQGNVAVVPDPGGTTTTSRPATTTTRLTSTTQGNNPTTTTRPPGGTTNTIKGNISGSTSTTIASATSSSAAVGSTDAALARADSEPSRGGARASSSSSWEDYSSLASLGSE